MESLTQPAVVYATSALIMLLHNDRGVLALIAKKK